MKMYESPHCEWEEIKAQGMLCESLTEVSNEDYSSGGDYEW